MRHKRVRTPCRNRGRECIRERPGDKSDRSTETAIARPQNNASDGWKLNVGRGGGARETEETRSHGRHNTS